MKYCRFDQSDGQAHYGLVESVRTRFIPADSAYPSRTSQDGDVEGLRTRRIEPLALEHAALLPPVQPSKIVCIGRNYREHAAELGHEVPTGASAVFQAARRRCFRRGGTILRPKISERTDYEGELGVVIGEARATSCRQ